MNMLKTLVVVVLVSFSVNSYSTPFSTKDYAIVFFFGGSCGYCHTFAPKLTRFASDSGLFVYPYSVDGGVLQQFPQPFMADEETILIFFPDISAARTPATFLLNVNNFKFVRLTEGNVSYAKLLESYNGVISDPEVMRALQ